MSYYLWSARGLVGVERREELPGGRPRLSGRTARGVGALDAVARRAAADVPQGEAMSPKSRNQLARTILSLPLEMLGPRAAMVTLTLPGDWERWVPDGRVLEAKRDAFVRRWERRWGPLIGLWAKEFQRRGGPHLHFYVPLPEMPAEDFAGLQRRTIDAYGAAKRLGKYEARRVTPPIGRVRQGNFGGDFAMWLRRTWAELVTGNTVPAHYVRGADIRVMFWTEEQAASRSRAQVALYLAPEAGKKAQKEAPPGTGAAADGDAQHRQRRTRTGNRCACGSELSRQDLSRANRQGCPRPGAVGRVIRRRCTRRTRDANHGREWNQGARSMCAHRERRPACR